MSYCSHLYYCEPVQTSPVTRSKTIFHQCYNFDTIELSFLNSISRSIASQQFHKLRTILMFLALQHKDQEPFSSFLSISLTRFYFYPQDTLIYALYARHGFGFIFALLLVFPLVSQLALSMLLVEQWQSLLLHSHIEFTQAVLSSSIDQYGDHSMDINKILFSYVCIKSLF